MRRFLLTAMAIAVGAVARGAMAASAPVPLPPPPPPQTQPAPPTCVNQQDTAEYAPGVDAYGHRVAPADLPGSTTDVQISTQVYVETRTTNPQLRGAGVMVNLPGLQKPPVCPQPPPQSITIH